MRIHLLSDLHLEFGKYKLATDAFDVLVLAGDISAGKPGVIWAAQATKKPIIYVPGNHEFYSGQLERPLSTFTQTLQELVKTNGWNHLHILDNDSIEIDDTIFIGSILWTDYNLIGNAPLAKARAPSVMNDYRFIKEATPDNIERIHNISKQYLVETLDHFRDRKTVVVTHHAPSEQSIAPRYRDSYDTNMYYASNLDDILEQWSPSLWLHGHTHASSDYIINKTRVVANPRGYARMHQNENKNFNPKLILEC